MTAPPEISELIEKFARNLEAYRSGKYNETQVRVEFIDPFFIALGWDVHNKEGDAEAYKDVIRARSRQIPPNCPKRPRPNRPSTPNRCTDADIDLLAYKLYDDSDEEIQILEGTSKC